MEENYATWILEIGVSPTGFRTTAKLAAMLATRLTFGSALVIVSQPRNYHPALAKAWKAVLRTVESQRATSLGNSKREMREYEKLLIAVPFAVGPAETTTTSSVFIIHPDELGTIPDSIATIFFVAPVALPDLQFLGRRLPEGAKLVLFRRGAFPPTKEPAT